MSIFKRNPIISGYTFGDLKYDMMDITRRTAIVQSLKDDATAYIDYTIQEDESPEMLADRMYDDMSMYWIILMFNDIHDVRTEWPLSYSVFEDFINTKYPASRNAIHHYESIAYGTVVDIDWHDYDRESITNWEYEYRRNEELRNIKLPDESIISFIVEEHNRLIKE